MVIGEQELLGAAVIGMERIALWIGRCAVYEQLYFIGGVTVPDVARTAIDGLYSALLALYATILQVLSRLIKVFNGISSYSPFQKAL